MRQTTVISVRGRKREELLADPNFVYVGRAVPRAGWKRGFWGNPYRLRKGENPGTAVDAFRRKIEKALATPDAEPTSLPRSRLLETAYAVAVKAGLPELRGKTLGCWCCDWRPGQPITRPCHAIVLAQLADAMPSPSESN